jgi:hypothetical protein
MSSVEETLQERGKRYGEFATHALVTQRLKHGMRLTERWSALAPDQQEALDMIVHKIGRILNGDPDYADSWHDIAGYATLVEQRLVRKATDIAGVSSPKISLNTEGWITEGWIANAAGAAGQKRCVMCGVAKVGGGPHAPWCQNQ